MRGSVTGLMLSANCRKRVADWMQPLRGEGVRGVNLVAAYL